MEHAKVVRNAMEGVWDMTEGIWNTTEDISNMTEDVCAGGLIRAAHKSCPCSDDEEVGEGTERGDAKDN